jgi:hypothetical protein
LDGDSVDDPIENDFEPAAEFSVTLLAFAKSGLALFRSGTGRLLANELASGLLGFSLVGQIARDFAETAKLTARAAKSRDEDAGPKERSVLPDAPPFLLEATGLGGDAKLVERLAGSDFVSRVET